jgi:hypothetical protein
MNKTKKSYKFLVRKLGNNRQGIIRELFNIFYIIIGFACPKYGQAIND